MIGFDHNPGVTEMSSTTVEVHYAFAQDKKTGRYTPVPDMVGFPVQMSKVQDTTKWEAGDLPTHPSFGHTHNTSPVQLAQDMCSVKAGKVAYIHSMENHPVR